MKHSLSRAAAAATIVALSIALPAAAQTAKSIAGSYSAVSVPAFGDKPRGSMILAPDGRYSIIVARATLPKIKSGIRNKGTPDENKTVVDGSIAHWGKYTVDDGGKAITFHVEGSSFPNWDSTTQKRALKVKGDTLTYVVSAPSVGGPANEVVWKRIK
jgi:hypothetical protein